MFVSGDVIHTRVWLWIYDVGTEADQRVTCFTINRGVVASQRASEQRPLQHDGEWR